MRLDTDDRGKSHYFFCDIRKKHSLPGVFVAKETTGGSIPCDAMPPVRSDYATPKVFRSGWLIVPSTAMPFLLSKAAMALRVWGPITPSTTPW